MKTPVNQRNITHITRDAAHRGDAGPPPDVKSLLDQAFTRMDARQKEMMAAIADIKGHDPDAVSARDALTARLAKLVERQEKLAALVENPPAGFDFAAVLYSRVDHDQAHKVRSEFNNRARAGFLKFIAEKHPDQLRAFGMTEEGIDRMRHGYDPITADGRLYYISVDHIIEKSGSGKMAFERVPDPLHLEAGSGDVKGSYRANHYNNLILMPDDIHWAKNLLNDAQGVPQIEIGQHRWVAMLIPKRDGKTPAYVAIPHESQPQYALRERPFTLETAVGLANYKLKKTSHVCDILYSDPLFADIAAYMDMLTKRLCARGAFNGASADQRKQFATKTAPIMRASLEADETLARLYDGRVAPLLTELSDSLTYTFKKVTEPGISHEYLKQFRAFFEGQRMQDLYARITNLPLPETQLLAATCDAINKEIRDIESKRQRAISEGSLKLKHFKPNDNDNTARRPHQYRQRRRRQGQGR